MVKHLLSILDLKRDDIICLINDAIKIKKKLIDVSSALKGKVLGMIFQKPSTRTRVSFEVAMLQMGGHAIYLGWDQLQLGRGETIGDTARVLSRYVDIIMARVYSHDTLIEFAKYSNIPVINGLSDTFHPVQILSDLLTIYEKFGVLSGLTLTYIGDGNNNICHSLLIGCATMGININIAAPKEYMPRSDIVKKAAERAAFSGARIKFYEEPREAVEKADIIYTDTFVSMGVESEREKRLKIFLPKYQVTKELFKYTNKSTIFMHCLPAHRGEEVTDEVIDGEFSVVWDQAENRLHMQKAILRWILRES